MTTNTIWQLIDISGLMVGRIIIKEENAYNINDAHNIMTRLLNNARMPAKCIKDIPETYPPAIRQRLAKSNFDNSCILYAYPCNDAGIRSTCASAKYQMHYHNIHML